MCVGWDKCGGATSSSRSRLLRRGTFLGQHSALLEGTKWRTRQPFIPRFIPYPSRAPRESSLSSSPPSFANPFSLSLARSQTSRRRSPFTRDPFVSSHSFPHVGRVSPPLYFYLSPRFSSLLFSSDREGASEEGRVINK